MKSNVPVVPFCITYRYAKGKNYLSKKPKVNITILEPIYPDVSLSPADAKAKLAAQTEEAMRKVIDSEDNVAFYEYIKRDEKMNETSQEGEN